MSQNGIDFLNSLISQGRCVNVAVLDTELKERINALIEAETGIQLPFEVDSDIETGRFLMEIDFESLRDEEYAKLGEVYACPQEMYSFTDVIVERLFGPNAVIFLSEEAENELLTDGDPMGATLCFSISLQPMEACLTKNNPTSFAEVSWSYEDVWTSLNDLGVEPITEELVHQIMETPRLETIMQDRMIECGWNVLKDAVSEILANE